MQMNKPAQIFWVVLLSAGCGHDDGPTAPAPASNEAVVKPAEDTETLYANPGMGWQTFYETADHDANLAGLPSATVYRRFGWHELEPEEGRLDFSFLEQQLLLAKNAGQRLAWRMMVWASESESSSPPLGYAPLWLRQKGASGYIYYFDGNENDKQDLPSEPDLWAPDLADPQVKTLHDRLVAELGRRYDQHPYMDLLDIGSVGLWGEWHFWRAIIKELVGNPPSGGKPGEWVPELSETLKRDIIDGWVAAFPTTPKTMLIGDANGLQRATSLYQTGWRADCWGDMNWHMPTFYDPQLQATNATAAWQNGPVALEPCWTMRDWLDRGWPIGYIMDWALSHHATYIQNKGTAIPQTWLPEVQRVLRKIGYRLVLRELKHSQVVSRDSTLKISMQWENVGAAPPYWDYHLTVRLKQGNTAQVFSKLCSMKGWQPGKRNESVEVAPPQSLPAGEYDLALGIFSPAPEAQHPNLKFIKLAIKTPPDANGWYVLSRVRLK